MKKTEQDKSQMEQSVVPAAAPPEMTLFISSTRGQKRNTSYPYETVIHTAEDLAEAVQYDHVSARYADGKNNRGRLIKAYRSKKTFQSSNCLPMDCDNCNPNPLEDDTPEEEWKTPDDVRKAFPDVPFYVVYSRNHMKEKNGKAARPRFHVYFPISEVTSRNAYEKLKSETQKRFPAFDDNAVDGARFFFGVENPKVEYFEGDTLINVFLAAPPLPDVIPSGSRNATLLSFAGRVLKRFGETDKAYDQFISASERCDEPLDDEELSTIWKNAVGFFHSTVEAEPGYIPSDEFDGMDFDDLEKKMITSDDIRKALKSMGITVRLNVITGKVDIHGMPDRLSSSNAPNTLPMLISDYFSRRHIRVTRQMIDDSLVLIEDENRFNPVEEMLKLIRWDEKDRIGELCSVLGIGEAVPDVSDVKDIKPSPHYMWGENHETVFLVKWLHQCIAMALNEDKKPYGADGVLVLRAQQGMGKTLFCRTVALNPDWFAEGVSIDLDNKDSVIQGTGVWIAELGELDSTLKREQSALKAFITSARDTYRQPYARVAVSKPRRTSFCATVNPKEFLNDETGSRRYWVIQPETIDVGKLKTLDKSWLCQMWAQVYAMLYLPDPQGFRLTDEERDTLQKNNEQFEKPLSGEVEILERLYWDVPVKYWKWKKTSEVISDLSLRGITPSQMGKVLNKLVTRDERIETKSPHNVRHYLLPPMYDPVDDIPALMGD